MQSATVRRAKRTTPYVAAPGRIRGTAGRVKNLIISYRHTDRNAYRNTPQRTKNGMNRNARNIKKSHIGRGEA